MHIYHILPCIMHTHILCMLYTELLWPLLYPRYVIIIPTYNAHAYFPQKYLSKKVCIIHGKIWHLLFFQTYFGCSSIFYPYLSTKRRKQILSAITLLWIHQITIHLFKWCSAIMCMLLYASRALLHSWIEFLDTRLSVHLLICRISPTFISLTFTTPLSTTSNKSPINLNYFDNFHSCFLWSK